MNVHYYRKSIILVTIVHVQRMRYARCSEMSEQYAWTGLAKARAKVKSHLQSECYRHRTSDNSRITEFNTSFFSFSFSTLVPCGRLHTVFALNKSTTWHCHISHETPRGSLLRTILLYIYSFAPDNIGPYRQIYRPTWTDQTSETETRESYFQQANCLLFGWQAKTVIVNRIWVMHKCAKTRWTQFKKHRSITLDQCLF